MPKMSQILVIEIWSLNVWIRLIVDEFTTILPWLNVFLQLPVLRASVWFLSLYGLSWAILNDLFDTCTGFPWAYLRR